MTGSALARLGFMAVTLLPLGGCISSLTTSDDASAGPADAKSCPTGSIDDLEDGNQQIAAHDGRAGYWYTFADEEGTSIAPDGEFETTDQGAAGSKRAARIAGHTADGKNVWAGMGFSFANPKLPYDASKYRGIAFYARHAKGSTPVVKVRLSDTNTDPVGGKCKECWNDFGTQLVLTPEWKRYVLLFDEIAQEPGWGEQKEAVASGELLELKWQIGTRNVDYDIWVDGIEFVGCP
jgi:endoglucanase